MPLRVEQGVVDRPVAGVRFEIEVDLLLVVRVPSQSDEERIHDPVANLLFGDLGHVPEHLLGDLAEVGEPPAQVDCFHRRDDGWVCALNLPVRVVRPLSHSLEPQEPLDGLERRREPVVRRKSEPVR